MKHVFVLTGAGKGKHSRRIEDAFHRLRAHTELSIEVYLGRNRHDVSKIIPFMEVDVPESFNDHQASIWLKTSLANITQTSTIYAYLDTDIYPIGEIDKLFEAYKAPINFAQDIGYIDHFSPAAMKCNCQKLFNEYFHYADSQLDFAVLNEKQQKLHLYLHNHSKILKIWNFLKFNFSPNAFSYGNEFYFSKKEKKWVDNKNNTILYHNPKQQLESSGNAYILKKTDYPTLNYDETIACNHLRIYLMEEYNLQLNSHVKIWNGGMFLFTSQSNDFLNLWHKTTLENLSSEQCKTKDQIGLVVAMKKYGLSAEHHFIPSKWNMIILDNDPQNPKYKSLGAHFIHAINS